MPKNDGSIEEGIGISQNGWDEMRIQAVFDKDIDYDFGGQIWAGKQGDQINTL